MAFEKAVRKRVSRYGFVAVAALVLAVLATIPASAYFTRLGGDLLLRFSVRPLGEPSSVSLIVVDEVTHRTAPFSETPEVAWTPKMAAVLNAVGQAGPRVVGLDIVYPKSLDSFLPGFDRPFLEALSSLGQARRLVLSEVRLSDETIAPYPAQQIAAGADNIRPVLLTPDIDGVVRRYPVEAAREFGPGVPTFAAELAARAGRKPTRPFLIDFRRPPAEIPAYRLADLHHCLEAGDLRPFQEFRGKVVIVGLALDIEDRHVAANRFVRDKQVAVRPLSCAPAAAPTGTPRQTTPGLLLQAHAVDTIIRGSAPTPLNWFAGGLASFVSFLGLGLVFLFLRPILGAIAWVFASLVLFGLALFFYQQGSVAPWIQWTVGGLILFAVIYAYRTRVEDRAKRQIATAFGRYLSPALVRQLTDDPESLRLGGEHRQVAVMFTDLEGFTTFSELHADRPERIVARLNTLFAKINDIVDHHGGYVDKFLGDGVMAVWGAPLPSDRPAVDAAKAALAIADAFDALALQSAAHDEMPLRIRIGLSAGVVLAGNLGSGRRYNYTVVGEPANRAARLQEACKTYEVGILCDGEFAQALGSAFETRLVAQAVLRGSTQAIEIWAILRGSAGGASGGGVG